MTTTITGGSSPIVPQLALVEGYETQTESGNIIHELADGTIAVSLRQDAPRTGTLSLLFADAAAATVARNAHREAGAVFTLTDTDTPQIDMSYVRAGGMSVQINEDLPTPWVLEIGYQEVIV